MTTQFKTLFTLSVMHEYYGGVCQDFDYISPAPTRKLLNDGKLLGKARNGVLHCLYEADGAGAALRPLNGARLVFGLRLTNPHFNNFTVVDAANRALLFRNRNAPSTLDAVLPVDLAAARLQHQLTSTSGVIDVNLNDRDGQRLQSHSVDCGATEEFNFDLSALPGGYYQVEEGDGTSPPTRDYYLEPELHKRGVFGIAEIAIDAAFYTSPPAFEIAFGARQETLKYYVVASNYSAAEFSRLTISDQGFGEEGRAEILFDRVAAAAFGSDEIEPGLLAADDARVDLFKSRSMLGRRHRARRHLQLKLNGDVLIPHLPAPGVDKARSELIIHVAKP